MHCKMLKLDTTVFSHNFSVLLQSCLLRPVYLVSADMHVYASVWSSHSQLNTRLNYLGDVIRFLKGGVISRVVATRVPR